MIRRITLILLSFFCIINAQISLPTFQAVHLPHNTSSSTVGPVIAGRYAQMGAILANGTVKFWGRNTYGQLGQGNTTQIGDGSSEMGDNLSAVDLGTGRTATAIAGSYYSTIVRLDDGTIKAWGYNGHGQLGQGNTTNIGDGSDEMGDNLSVIDLSSSSDVTLD